MVRKKAATGILGGTFEQLEDFSKRTTKQATQALGRTFSPLNILEGVIHGVDYSSLEKAEEKKEKTANNNTPLDIEKLREKYHNQDRQKTEFLRNRLFQLVKSGEEKAIAEEKKAKEEKARKEEMEADEKKRQEEERKKQEEQLPMPKGKVRRSIFSPKKMAERQNAEVRPSSGKH
ncbi:MAG: hypothetical protein QHH09_01800 [Microgenomates group bacterium]|nr:hypothetical protein [Microgenomates group bacterium]